MRLYYCYIDNSACAHFANKEKKCYILPISNLIFKNIYRLNFRKSNSKGRIIMSLPASPKNVDSDSTGLTSCPNTRSLGGREMSIDNDYRDEIVSPPILFYLPRPF